MIFVGIYMDHVITGGDFRQHPGARGVDPKLIEFTPSKVTETSQ